MKGKPNRMLKNIILIAGSAAVSGSLLFSNDTAIQEDMFQTYVQEYGKR